MAIATATKADSMARGQITAVPPAETQTASAVSRQDKLLSFEEGAPRRSGNMRAADERTSRGVIPSWLFNRYIGSHPRCYLAKRLSRRGKVWLGLKLAFEVGSGFAKPTELLNHAARVVGDREMWPHSNSLGVVSKCTITDAESTACDAAVEVEPGDHAIASLKSRNARAGSLAESQMEFRLE